MKKLSALILALLLIVSFAGCGKKEVNKPSETEKVTVRLAGLKGPTTMGMVKLLDEGEKGNTKNNYVFTMAGTADEITPKLLKGELDIAAIPANLGAVLNKNSNGEIKMLAINTLGVVYIVEKGCNTVNSLADLKGKTVYATGKGSTPEYVLRYLLDKNGLNPDNDVNIVWKSEPTEAVAQMSAQENSIAMLPQPFVTVALNQIEGLRVAIDLNKEWEKSGADGKLVTAGLVVRNDFAKNNPEAVKAFIEEYKNSTDFINNNVDEASLLVEKYDIVKSPIAKKAIPGCNIVCITGEEMRTSLEGYFQTLFEQNPKSLGGKMPEKDFYLIYE